MDTISLGGTISWAMECWDEGLITAEDTGGLELNWGNHEVIVKLTKMIAAREGFGDLLAEGSFRAAKKIGFEWGEMNNLASTWTFSLKQYLSQTGKRVSDLSPKEWQNIGAQASGYALGMHKAGTMAYQQGLMSLLTQFWSIQHKAVAAMMPGRFGSKAFTNSQKAGVAATQLMFYGAAGLGIEELVRDIYATTGVLDEVPQDRANNIVRITTTGIGEMLLNHVLTEEAGERVDLSFSSSFAPAGAPVSTVVDFMMTLVHLGGMEALMQQTAGGSTFGRYTDMAQYLHYTLAMSETLPDTPGKVERVLALSPTVFSGWNNAMKAFYAMRTGQLVTRFGDHRTHITYSVSTDRPVDERGQRYQTQNCRVCIY